MRHLVYTRLMVGAARPSAFLLHTKILLETVYPSMAGQTVQDFDWVVVTEHLIDDESRALIEAAFAGHPNFHLDTVDSFAFAADEDVVAELSEKYFGTSKDIISTRLDDDDALRLDYFEKTHRAFAATEGLASYSHKVGVAVASHIMRHGVWSSDRPQNAGLSVFSPDVHEIHAHSFKHFDVHEGVAARGGTVIFSDDPEPHFMKGDHEQSESRERRDHLKMRRRQKRTMAVSDPADPAYRALLASFGLAADFDERVNMIRKRNPDPAPPLLVMPGLDRLPKRRGLKRQYRMMGNDLRERMKTAQGREHEQLETQLHLMRQAYYLV